MFENLEPRLLLAHAWGIIPPGDPPPAQDLAAGVIVEWLEPGLVADSAAPRHELVFVEGNVPDYQQVLDDIRSQAREGTQVDVVLLDARRDGIEQISEVLATQRDLDSVHIISHGADGMLDLGRATLDAASLARRSGDIARWGDALSAEGDLFLYACDLAESDAGEQFVRQLGLLTGADVAASEDLTGAASLGGNWDLEYRIGAIESHEVLSAAAQAAWGNVLATVRDNFSTVSYSNNDGTTNWSTDWVETDAAGNGAGGGDIKVAAGQLQMYSHTVGNNIYREANLSGATTATLSFWYNNLLSASDNTAVQVSGNGGSSYTTLATFSSGSNPGTGTKSLDISAYSATSTRVRFLYVLTNKRYLYVDDVQISFSTPNNAPVLDDTKNPTLTAQNEDSGAPSGAVGTLVSSMVDFAVPSGQVDNVTDADSGALLGIAITAADTTNGTWYYSTNNGTNWNALGAVSNNSARLLAADANTRLYFQPNADYSGTLAAAITFRAWDQTSGSNGGLADTSTNGGMTAFSTATDTASLVVNAVNDAPVITSNGGGDTASVSIAENTTAVTTVASSDVDGGAPVYSISGGADAAKFTIHSSTGALSFLAAPNYEAPTDAGANNVYDVTVQVSDGNGGTDMQAIAVTVTNVNEAPVVNDQGFSVAENAANGTVAGTVTASDPDAGDTLTYSITGGNTGNAFAINASTGQITVNNTAALDYETLPAFSLTVQVEDAGHLTDTATVTVNLTNVNEAPTVSDAVFSLPENSGDGTVVGTVTATDPDAGDTLTYTITAGNTNGAFAINGSTGQITVANSAVLDYETTPSFVLTVQVEDAGHLTDTAAVTVTLTNVNESPVVNDQGFSVAENAANGTVVGTAVASDVDAGDTLTYSITAGNTGNAFAINANTGQITVSNAAALDFETTPTFALTVQVEDAGGLTDAASVTINLTNVNESPTVDDAIFSLPENSANGTVIGTATGSDPDAGDALSYSIAGGNTNNAFAIDANTGQITVNNSAALDLETSPTFVLTVRVRDAGGLTDTATTTVSLTNVNEAPTANDAPFSLPENSANGTVVGSVTASDPDAGDTLTYSIAGGNTGNAFAIDAGSGQITVANSAVLDYETTASFTLTIQAQDAAGLTDTATATIDLTNVNEAPMAYDADLSLPENSANGTVVGTLSATDLDGGDTLTYIITGGNTNNAFVINPSTGQITVGNAAALDLETTPAFALTVQVEDAGHLTDTAIVAVNLSNVNEAPTLNDTGFSLPENSANGTVVGTATATDPDAGDALTYSITAGNTGNAFTIDAETGEITVSNSAALDYETNPTFNLTVQVEDEGSLTAAATIAIGLNDVNESPVVSEQGFSVDEISPNGTVVGTVTASDLDAGDTLTYSILGGNTNNAFTVNASTGQITVANSAAIDYETTAAFHLTIQVRDSDGLTDTATATVSLMNVNEAPAVDNATFVLPENSSNGAVVGTVTATDPDAGDTLTYTITRGNTGNAFAINASTGQIMASNAAALDFETTPTFSLTVQVEDAGSLTDFATVTIDLTNLNEAPTVSAALFSLTENSGDGTVVGTVTATDPDAGDTLAYSITGGNTNNAFAINPHTGQITVANSSALDFETTPTFDLTVQVEDAGGLTGSSTATIRLTNVNEAPTVSTTPATTGVPGIQEPAVDEPVAPFETESLVSSTSEPPSISKDTGFETGPAIATTAKSPSTGGGHGGAGNGAIPAIPADDPLDSQPAPSDVETPKTEQEPAPQASIAKPVDSTGTVHSQSRAGSSGAHAQESRHAVTVHAEAKRSVAATDVVAANGILWRGLDKIREQMDRQVSDDARWRTTAVGVTAGLSLALSAGYIVWTVQSGWLAMGTLASLRLWRWADPLPILEYWEETAHRIRVRRTKGMPVEDEAERLIGKISARRQGPQ